MMKLILAGGVLGFLGWSAFGLADIVLGILGLGVTLFVAALLLEVLAMILDKIPGWPVGRAPNQRRLQRERPLF